MHSRQLNLLVQWSNNGFEGKTSKPHIWNNFDGIFIELIQECEYKSKTRINQSLNCQLKDERNAKDRKIFYVENYYNLNL
jgi:hypothetical protein